MTAGSCAACGNDGSNSTACTRCTNVVYCSPGCLRAHWQTHKEVCGLLPRASPSPAAVTPAAGPSSAGLTPLVFGSKEIADAARSLLRERASAPESKGVAAKEQERILRNFADSAAGKQEDRSAARPARSPVLPMGPGLRELCAASNQAEAEEAWAAQAAAGEMANLPQLHALITGEISTEEDYTNFSYCLQSICKQWRAPPEHCLVSWHAEVEELRGKMEALMVEFVQAIEGAGPRVAYASGPVRAVRCRATTLEQPARLSVGEHLRALLELVPDAENSWVVLSDQDGLWHPGRTAFFRNFTRQVPGPGQCTATVAPVIARPASQAASVGETFAGALAVNKMLQQGHPSVVVKEEPSEFSQYCMRRSLVAAFFDTHGQAVISHELCQARIHSFVARDNGPKCLQVAPEQFRAEQPGAAPMWMVFCRRWCSPLHQASAVASPADAARAGDSLEAVRQALPAAGVDAERLAGFIARLRQQVEYLVLTHWSGKSPPELATVVLESVDPAYKADACLVQNWLLPLAESLAAEAREAFALVSATEA